MGWRVNVSTADRVEMGCGRRSRHEGVTARLQLSVCFWAVQLLVV
jgi:hypothetical protein